jgi:IS5 family transposase
MEEKGSAMLIDCHQPEDVFARVPEVATQTDPVLLHLDRLLDDDELFAQVKGDLSQRHRWSLVRGRHSTPVEVILRMLICKHLYQWSFQETQERVQDSLVLRWFCRVYFEHVPDDTTLIRWAGMIRPETLHQLNDRVVHLAWQAKVTRGRKLRVDATCVQTTIHHPTDSGLLVDSVRTLSRFVQQAKPYVEGTIKNVKETCRSRLRSARRAAQSLHRLLRHTGAEKQEKQEQQKALYQCLITTTEQMVRQAEYVEQALVTQMQATSQKTVQHLLSHAEQVLPLIHRVIAQSRARVLEGRKVASEEKVLSLHEPQTRIIPRHKGGALVEFGRQVVLDEVEGGLITRYEVLADGDSDRGQGIPAVDHHRQLFGHPPRMLAGDRGIHSKTTVSHVQAVGVKVVAIPALGHLSRERQAEERSRCWKRAYRWRAGIEGRIHSLRRDYGLRKCAYHGQDGMERWIGLGVIASNLRHIAQAAEA